ncbi:mitotic spindle assembly checkpoint protein MAD1 isoform X2 [Diabrotica virgifera virgifera]|uniref:Mitotic spindle assembly checkpoint protein MAD1 isoform X2 n=1 Tax=Diabrotica virgifera virgifera TaxID=50390 RepID=A0A6P7H625_DIAVI|nr:mitotic spindle assembly checkpoint protein MAD1 isoform X2 [Diabrotica virgifera virgifera]
MSEYIDDTILNMVKNLKSTRDKSRNNYEFASLKRSLSSSNSNESSIEEATPIKKMKQDRKFDLSYVGSPREMNRLRVDLLEARNIIKSLETRVTHMHTVRQQMQMMFEDENKTLKRQCEYDKKTIEELENQLQTVRKREIDLKHELSEKNKKYDMLKITTSEEVQKLESSLLDVKEESRQMESEENGIVPTLERKIRELETMLEAAEEDAEAHKKLADELGQRISKDNAVQRDLELKEQELLSAKLYIKELEYAKESYGEFQEYSKSQAEKLERYMELEKQNEQLIEETDRLKEQVKNKLILEEEVYDLKNRLVKFKDCEKKLIELQIQETQNALCLNEWRAVARGICESTEADSALPHLLRVVVDRLQQQELVLTSAKVDLESQLKSMTHEAKVAKSEAEKCQKLVAELKETSAQKQKLIHRMEKKLMLVIRERDSYRLQLDSYERDLTMYISVPTTGAGSTSSQSQKERIDNLEKIVADYRDLVTKLEGDLEVAQPNLHAVLPIRAEQMARLKDEVHHLKLENDKLRQRKDQLEIQLESYMEGEDTRSDGKILHPSNNPLSECLVQRGKQVEKLQQEIGNLKRKIKNMEEGIECSKLGDITLTGKEITQLKEQLQSQENQNQLLKEYFKSQMQEFRNVIYMLLGYKIDRTQNSLYKLTSLYAEQADDLLCFQVNKDGDLNLLENEFSATLDKMINLHLRHQKSIPVFLSALTMDLFQNKTMTTKSYETELDE